MRLAALRHLSLVALLSAAACGTTAAATLAEVEALVKRGDPRALAAAEALVEANEGNARAWILLTRAQLRRGQDVEAVESAEQAVELAPDDAQAQFWLGNALGNRIGQVNMLRKMAMAPDLRDAFEAAVRLDPALLDAREALIQFYLNAPSAMGGGAEKAALQVAEIARRNPVRGHLAQAGIHRFNKDQAAVARSIDAAVAAAPRLPQDDIDSRVGVAINLVALERHDQALAFLQLWAAAQPQVAAPHYQLGRLAAISGQHVDAGVAGLKRYLDPALAKRDMDPSPANAWWRLGQIEAKGGDAAAARTAFETALKLEPDHAEAKKGLAAL